ASGAAYVVVLHLSPEHESRLAEVLQATTPMPVERVTEATRVVPDRVYVISPNTSLRMAGGMLTVSDVLRMEERRAPVDIFFRTLADAHGSDAVAIVLSGTGPNGSNGIKRVKECGGLVIAQDPSEAEHDDMPRNSIETGCVDYVLRVAEMPGRIAAYQAQRGHAATAAPAAGDEPAPALLDILTALRVRTGHDFSNYKTATVQRRIERRRHLHELPDLPAYARFVRQHPGEAMSLLQELLISVTHFFRDAPVFAALEQHVVPRLFKGRTSPDHLRVWVAGCATGEEAYSVAMLLAEAAELAQESALQVFATDLDETAVAYARDGFYTDADVADVSPERLRRFFMREPGGYRVKRDLRESVLFAHHDVLKDPPFSHLDLVCCRNLLIYLNRAAQQSVLETFHFALNPGGYLLLGNSETADVSGELFATIDKNAQIYERRTLAVRPLPPVPDLTALQRVALPPAASQFRSPPRGAERPSAADLHFQLLEHLAPPSIVINEDHQIVHVSPNAGEYLQVSGGEPSRDLMRLIRPELRVDLRTALYQAARDRTTIELRGANVAVRGNLRHVRVSVRPVLRESDPLRGFFIVLFDDRDVEAAVSSEVPPVTSAEADAAAQLE
ncbi:MAG: PAS domain-containing protein, partial [Candidatus Rokuibacteriota bacterium]